MRRRRRIGKPSATHLDAILYLTGGIIGTGHHWYFTGQGALNMGLASCFSALEVVPLTLLTLDAWDFIQLSKAQSSARDYDMISGQKWSIYFLAFCWPGNGR